MKLELNSILEVSRFFILVNPWFCTARLCNYNSTIYILSRKCFHINILVCIRNYFCTVYLIGKLGSSSMMHVETVISARGCSQIFVSVFRKFKGYVLYFSNFSNFHISFFLFFLQCWPLEKNLSKVDFNAYDSMRLKMNFKILGGNKGLVLNERTGNKIWLPKVKVFLFTKKLSHKNLQKRLLVLMLFGKKSSWCKQSFMQFLWAN